jgi:poly(3-hydroxybutyrate) depolymerase
MKSIVFCLMFLALGRQGRAETIQKTAKIGGMTVNYKVVLPRGYDATRAYPTVLAFAGGGQTMNVVDSTLDLNWRAEAERRGYIIVSPAAPNDQLFFEGGDRIFPAFLDQILRDYKVESGKLHLAGRSNGGISAFHIGALYPQYFRSLTGFPGYLPEDTDAKIAGLKPLCIFMHVGELDTGWLTEMRQQSEVFRKKGLNVRFTVEKGQEHALATLTGAGSKRLFDQLEEAARGCK